MVTNKFVKWYHHSDFHNEIVVKSLVITLQPNLYVTPKSLKDRQTDRIATPRPR